MLKESQGMQFLEEFLKEKTFQELGHLILSNFMPTQQGNNLQHELPALEDPDSTDSLWV